MTRREQVLVALQRALIAMLCASVAYLCVIAAFSWAPPVWFGRPGSAATWVIVAGAVTAVCVLSYRVQARERPGAVPAGVIAILATTSAALAFSSFLGCHGPKNHPVVTALLWTVQTVRGHSSEEFLANGKTCPPVTPVALDIARAEGELVLYVGVIAIFVSLFSTEIDRARIKLARSVTAIIDFDDDSRSLVTAVAQTVRKDKRRQLALIVARSQVNAAHDLRSQGARIVVADLDELGRLDLLPLWKKTHQLYLLSASFTTNRHRLAAIEARLRKVTKRQRLPLVVRIDDPWQAHSWRAQRLGGSNTLWAAHALSIHEVTAERLLDRILAGGEIKRIAACGTSPLMLALCASLARRQLDRSYTGAGAPPLPTLTIVAKSAEEYRREIDLHHRQLGFPPADEWLSAVNAVPSLTSLVGVINASPVAHPPVDSADGDAGTKAEPLMKAEGAAAGTNGRRPWRSTWGRAWGKTATRMSLRARTLGRPAPADPERPARAATSGVTVGNAHPAGADATLDNSTPGVSADGKASDTGDESASLAVIFTVPEGQGGVEAMLGTRLAARFPDMPIFVLDPKTDSRQDTLSPLVGQLRTFRPAMDVPDGKGHDPWERAAMLIHERYAAQGGHDSAVTKPWADLDEFYRGSNRRLVRNILWIVEQKAGHTWDTFGGVPDQPLPADLADAPPLQRLAAIGFDSDTAIDMARTEHNDWVRYERKGGWRYGPQRDNVRKQRPDLMPWDTLVEKNPGARDVALNSLATTLYSLRELGFRSRPLFRRYRRTGIVTATRRRRPWTWTTESGDTVRARAGDWQVSDHGGGSTWSVRDKAFRCAHVNIGGNRYRRTGYVLARSARDGETIETVDGPLVTTDSDWVLKGADGEQWVVSPEVFARHYEPVHSGENVAADAADP